MLPGMELMNCQALAVPRDVMHHVVHVESSFNPYAIGVVGGHLVRQPKNLPEALATVRMLERKGYNFSLGLAQVNRYNLGKYGLDSYEKAFQACPNLQAGSRILAECYSRSGGDWGKSFSCYYSGDSVTGYRHGYVQKIYASIRASQRNAETPTRDPAIPVIGKPSRRPADHSRYPTYSPTPARLGRVEQRMANASGQGQGAVLASESLPEPGQTTPLPSPEAAPVGAVLQAQALPAQVRPVQTAHSGATDIARLDATPADRAFVF